MSEIARAIERIRSRPKPIAVVGHRRSGTHVAIDFIRKQFPETSPPYKRGAPLGSLYIRLDSLKPGHHNPTQPGRVLAQLERTPRMVMHTTAVPEPDGSFPEFGDNESLARALIEHAVVINSVRNGRDVLSSQHLYEQGFAPDTPGGASEFIRSDFEGTPRPTYWSNHIGAWRVYDGVHVLRFEDLIRTPAAVMARLAESLGLEPRRAEPLLPRRLPRSRLGRLAYRWAGISESSEIVGGIAKSARPAKWHEVWSADDRAYFDKLAGQTLIDLGYEPDHGWAAP